MQGQLEESEARIKVNNEDLLLTVQVDDENWPLASDRVEEGGADSKIFKR